MSAIWENDDVKEKIMMLPPSMQEAFLRAVDSLYQRESSYMLTFIKESRDELRGTHKAIVKEQEVLRDTSDLLASKRIYGDPDDWKDTSYDTNAVDDYLKRRNQGELSGLGILSFEDEHKSHKKKKSKDKDRSRSSRTDRRGSGDILEKHSKKKHSLFETEDLGSGYIGSGENEKPKKEKKEKKEKHKDRDQEEEKPKKKESDEEREETKEKKKKKDKKREKSSRVDKDDPAPVHQTDSTLYKPEREKSAVALFMREKSDTQAIQQETNQLMQEFLTRETSNFDAKAQQEQAMMRKLARKKNPHAFEADQLLQQQRAAEIAREQEKKAYEAKMMEKLKMKRERSSASRDLSSLDEPGDSDKPKKDKKKKKSKDRDEEYDPERLDKEEKKKKKKKDKKDIDLEDV